MSVFVDVCPAMISRMPGEGKKAAYFALLLCDDAEHPHARTYCGYSNLASLTLCWHSMTICTHLLLNPFSHRVLNRITIDAQ